MSICSDVQRVQANALLSLVCVKLICRAERAHLEGDALDDVQRVNDIAQRLGHLAAVRIAHHAVQVHGAEGQLACTDSNAHMKPWACAMMDPHSWDYALT